MKAQYCFSCMNELAGQVASCPYCHAVLPYRIKDPNDLPAGMVLKKRYLVGRSLGRGGFGATYIARDLKKDKILTIKEYFPEFACLRNPGSNFVAFKPGTEDKFLSYQKEFRAEAQHLKMLRDIPGVVQYCDFFEAFGTCYLVMTYLEGKTLKDVQLEQHRPFSLQEGVDYTLRTLQVLSRVHGKKILHRDISPDNIFMTVNGQINLIDFGSSSLLSQANMTGFTKGVYTAPEQRINGAQSPATDLYAVGVTLFTLLINHKPKEAEGIHLEEMPEAVPQGIRAVYEKATQREMSQRYQSADEMARALSQASGVPLPPAPSNRKKKLRNLLLAMMALVAVLVAVMAMAFSGGTPDEAEATPTPVPATATPVVTDAPTATPVPVLPADSWLCRMQNQLYRISPMGTETVADGAFPVEESQLQPVEVQGLESYQLIYGLDQIQIVYLATGQCLTLSGAGDSAALWLQPGEYALRVARDDHVLAEAFNVPAQAPVRISAAGEEILESWWTDEAVSAEPTDVPHEHVWQEWVTKEATCVARGEMAQECLICGEAGETKAIPPLGHDMQDATCTDPALCVRCGAKDTVHQPALGHAWQAATCTEPKVCARCNETEGDAAGHQWDSASCTEPGTCKVCGATSGSSKDHAWGTWHGNTATCTAGGTEERICGECGTRENRDTKALGHAPGEEVTCTTDQKCTRCGAVLKAAKGHDRQSATCTEPAYCKVCGAVEADRFPALGHYPGAEATCTTAQTCKRCGVTLKDKLGHAPGAAATCTTAQKCTRCAATLKSALGHVPGAEATCTTAQTCTRCGAVLKAAKGHDRQSATCTEPAYCKVCGVVEADRFPALGHYPGAEATCTTAQTCKRCGAVLKEALGHAPAANVICTATQKCTRCGATLKETQGHAPGAAATCTAPQKCTRCGAILEPALGHSWGTWHGNTATCSAGGTEERICGNCGARENRTTEPLAHAYGAWKLVQEATCISPQASRRFCGTCGAVEWHYDDGIGAKKHSYVDGVCVWCQMSEPNVNIPLPQP